MIYPFTKRPRKSHFKRNSVSFSKAEVGCICFNDDVEITLFDTNNRLISENQYTGFEFLSSLVLKTLEDGTEIFAFKL